MIAVDEPVVRRGRPGAVTITRGVMDPAAVCSRASNGDALTQTEVGLLAGVTCKRICQIEAVAIGKLRAGLTCLAGELRREGVEVTTADLVRLVPDVLREMAP